MSDVFNKIQKSEENRKDPIQPIESQSNKGESTGMRFGIIVAFLLSIAAAGGAVFLQQSLTEERKEYSSLEAQYAQVREKLHFFQSEVKQFESEMERIQNERRGYTAERSKLTRELETNRRQATDLQKQVDRLKRDLAKASKAREALAQKKVAEVEVETSAPVRSTSFTAVPVKTTRFSRPTPPKIQATPPDFKPVVMAPKPVVRTRVPTPVIKETPVPAPEPTTTVSVSEPKILTVNRKFNFVVMNIGMVSGLKIGDNLEILRGSETLGLVQVEKLYDKFSAATILQEEDQNPIKEGDGVHKV